MHPLYCPLPTHVRLLSILGPPMSSSPHPCFFLSRQSTFEWQLASMPKPSVNTAKISLITSWFEKTTFKHVYNLPKVYIIGRFMWNGYYALKWHLSGHRFDVGRDKIRADIWACVISRFIAKNPSLLGSKDVFFPSYFRYMFLVD